MKVQGSPNMARGVHAWSGGPYSVQNTLGQCRATRQLRGNILAPELTGQLLPVSSQAKVIGKSVKKRQVL